MDRVVLPVSRTATAALAGEQARYTIDNGLRRVEPYQFTYNTSSKGRWYGRELLEIFVSEFRDREKDYYFSAVASGRVQVNSQTVPHDTVIRNGDIISHTIHRHEPPVSSAAIKVVFEDTDLGMIVVDKPAGIPVHPAGRYRHNSIIHIMRYEMNLPVISACNRLDRLTSGVMILATKSSTANEISVLMKSRGIKKRYVAKVSGEFPLDEIECREPVLNVSPKFGLNRIRVNGGKDAITKFERLWFDGQMSLVLCKPLTGRTHQIRVHLQHLGYPIANDSLYANPNIWGETFQNVSELSDELVVSRMQTIGKTVPSASLAWKDSGLGGGEMWSNSICKICSTPLYEDPTPDELELWLHAWKYADDEGKWAFETDLPSWAIKK